MKTDMRLVTGPVRDRQLFLVGWVGGAVIAAVVQAAAVFLAAWPAFNGRFSGPDSHMRLMRILECGGERCPGGIFPRSNAPFGEVLHWPYLLDRLILALSAPFQLVQPWAEAVVTAGYLLGPTIELVALALALIGARALVRRPTWVFAAAFLATQSWVAWAYAPARPDHHGLQALFFLGSVALAMRLLAGPPSRWVEAGVGAAVAGGLWVSVEGLVTVTVPLLVLALRWLVDGGRDWAWANTRVVGWATAVLFAAVLFDPPEAGRWAVVYDRISVAHLVMMGASGLLWSVLAVGTTRGGIVLRGIVAAGGLALTAIVLSWLFPGLPRGPLTDVDPRIITIWLDTVVEYVPFLDRPDLSAMIHGLAPVLVALPVALYGMVTGPEGRRWAWGMIAGCLVWLSLLGLVHGSRWAYYIQSLLPFAYCGLLDLMLKGANRARVGIPRATAQVGAVALLLVGVPVILAVASAKAGARTLGPVGKSVASACSVGDILPVLADPETVQARATILAPVFWGPEILFHTSLDVVATPYHRNHEGILDSRDIMASTDDEETLRQLRRREIEYIVLSRWGDWHPLLEGADGRSLYRRLQERRAPAFLDELPLPEGERCGLWRVTG